MDGKAHLRKRCGLWLAEYRGFQGMGKTPREAFEAVLMRWLGRGARY